MEKCRTSPRFCQSIDMYRLYRYSYFMNCLIPGVAEFASKLWILMLWISDSIRIAHKIIYLFAGSFLFVPSSFCFFRFYVFFVGILLSAWPPKKPIQAVKRRYAAFKKLYFSTSLLIQLEFFQPRMWFSSTTQTLMRQSRPSRSRQKRVQNRSELGAAPRSSGSHPRSSAVTRPWTLRIWCLPISGDGPTVWCDISCDR